MVRVGIVIVLVLWMHGSCFAQTDLGTAVCDHSEVMRSEDGALHKAVEKIVEARSAVGLGEAALYAVDLKSGKEVGIHADEPVQTASTIKLGILYEAMIAIRDGHTKWDEPIVMKPEDRVGGSGMLHFFDAPLTLTLKDVLTMMVIVSDNTATNMMIDRFGLDKINARMQSLGLRHTYLYKKVFKPAEGPMPIDQPKFGLGKTTPREMAKLMTDIGECRLHPSLMKPSTGEWMPIDQQDKAVCAVVLGMLKSQFYRDTVPRYLPNGGDQTVASKTGSLDAVRNDISIVAGKNGPTIISVFTFDNRDTSWTVDNEGEVTIARLAKLIVDAWSPEGLDAAELVPGLSLGSETGCPTAEKTMQKQP